MTWDNLSTFIILQIIFLHVCLYVCMSVCLFVFLPVFMYLCLSVSISVCLSVYACRSICRSVYFWVNLSVSEAMSHWPSALVMFSSGFTSAWLQKTIYPSIETIDWKNIPHTFIPIPHDHSVCAIHSVSVNTSNLIWEYWMQLKKVVYFRRQFGTAHIFLVTHFSIRSNHSS